MPVPSGKLGNRESIDGTDNSDRDNRPIQATRFGPIMLPDKMEGHRVIRGIEMVAVISPSARAQVDLDAAGAELASVEEDERVAKVWAETVTPGATVDNLQGDSVRRLEARRYRSRMPGGAEGDLGNPGWLLHSCPRERRRGSSPGSMETAL